LLRQVRRQSHRLHRPALCPEWCRRSRAAAQALGLEGRSCANLKTDLPWSRWWLRSPSSVWPYRLFSQAWPDGSRASPPRRAGSIVIR